MANALKVIIDRTAQVEAAIRLLASARVLVGIPAEKALRKPEPGETRTISNAAIGYIQENGAPEVGIPPRPHMRPAIKEAKQEIIAGFKVAGELAFAGKVEAVDRQLHRIGLRAQAAVRRKITTGPFLPLRPRTLAMRQARGRKGTKPLIDTGQYRNAINYVVRYE